MDVGSGFWVNITVAHSSHEVLWNGNSWKHSVITDAFFFFLLFFCCSEQWWSQKRQSPLWAPYSQVVYLSHEVPWSPWGCQSIKVQERELVTPSYFQGIITCLKVHPSPAVNLYSMWEATAIIGAALRIGHFITLEAIKYLSSQK